MQQLGDDIWQVTGPDFRMPAGVKLPASSTVIRLPDRSLLVYSPLPFDDVQVAALAAEGEVAHIVVPSLLHHLYAAQAAERWPRATVHAVPNIATKQPDLRVDRTLASGSAWDGAIDVELVGGAPKLGEAVLFHRASGTLVCADLMFNITRPANWQTRLVLSLTGSGGRLAQSREWRWARKDATAMRASRERILGWPIRQIAPCHGHVVAVTAAELDAVTSRMG